MQKNKRINTELKPSQVKELLRDVIKRNIDLGAQNKPTVSIGIYGPAGIAKTSIVEQITEEFNVHFIKQNIAEKEAGDLLGFPIVQLELKSTQDVEGEKYVWVNKDTVDSFIKMGYVPTGKDRMSFSKPDFIQGKEDKPCIMVLDDYNRGLPSMLNAIMDLVDRQKYSSWGLFPGSTVILTANPDDGEDDYNISTTDKAQMTRFLRINMKPSVEDWALQMELEGLDDRFINFLISNKELIEGTGDSNNTELANLRIWTKYFNLISMYDDLHKNWDKIFNLGQNSIPEEHLLYLYKFIENKLDKLPTVEEILTMKNQKKLNEKLNDVIGTGDNKRMDISSIISRRLMNYALVHHKKYTKEMALNYQFILKSEYLTPDLGLS